MSRNPCAGADGGHERLVRMDVRAVLWLVLCTMVASYLTPGLQAHAGLAVALVALACAFGRAALGLKLLLAYVLVTVWLQVDVRFGIIVPPPLALALVHRLIPIFVALGLLFALPAAKLTAGIRQLPIPAGAQLMLTVMLRFVPTVIAETAGIRDAMRVRGLLGSPLTFLRSPLRTVEYAVVPLIFRELKLADEISAAAVVRGIESPCVKHGYYVNRMRPADAAFMFVCLAFTAAAVAGPRLIAR